MAELVETVIEAFGHRSLPPPPEPNDSTHSEEFWEETGRFWGKDWDSLSLKDYQNNMYVLDFLPDSAFAYYLAGLVILALKADDYENDCLTNFLMRGLWRNAKGKKVADAKLENIAKKLTKREINALKKFVAIATNKTLVFSAHEKETILKSFNELPG